MSTVQDDGMQDERMQEGPTNDDRASDERARPDDTIDEVLFGPEDSASFEARWTDVQKEFVDNPQHAVEAADRLVSEVMQTLAGRFAERKEALEQQWSTGDHVQTEDLRQAMQHYRTFLHRLLAA